MLCNKVQCGLAGVDGRGLPGDCAGNRSSRAE